MINGRRSAINNQYRLNLTKRLCQKQIRKVSVLIFLLVLIGCGGGGGETDKIVTQQAVENAFFQLDWGAPTKDEDGNVLTDLSGYVIYYGAIARTGADPKVCGMCGYQAKIDVGNVLTYTLTIPEGSYYFSVSAYDTEGNESVFSAEILAN